ncbi:HNH endonuclease [Anaerosacchariphilus polymeriproducens]|uniref:HNH endonuclease n=1 Tax=Anaerosacchariphilus polymeriproducens TaxID=1812858 RepID=A0A371ARK1_9FIRM|nr:HNH endonuclease [Anaerosacchariphilus polymeriproducens]RDU22198.1 HNH endonuclease [Anaerosacchariphilus polymeriproducens]
MTTQEIIELIKIDKLYQFYKSKEWMSLKNEVLKEHHNECVWCKQQGIIKKAVTVHHVQFVKKHPYLALSRYYTYKGKTYENLLPLCHDCHDKAHGRFQYKKKEQWNEEKW